MTRIIRNPGTQPIRANATFEQAVENMKQFVLDMADTSLSWINRSDLDKVRGSIFFNEQRLQAWRARTQILHPDELCWSPLTDEEGDKKLLQQGEGRYLFQISCASRQCIVAMPGLPLDWVRYLGLEGQNILSFPRLYIDGNSWLWLYAIDSAREVLAVQVK